MRLSGWGRYPVIECRMERLRRSEDLTDLAPHGTLIARGNGRSYGDAALNSDLTLSMLAMDRMLAFDAATGLLTCEAGILLADIIETFVPRGWFPPVVPGTKFVTVGGMIAADVHGKNHHRDGTFGAYVESLTLATADGSVRECSRTEDSGLFRATLGGMGLTGVILRTRFRLVPIETASVIAETLAARDLDEAMAGLDASRDWPYSAVWIDAVARGPSLGRGLLMRGRFLERAELSAAQAADPLAMPRARRLKVPVDAPSMLINRASISLANELYYRRGQMNAAPRPMYFDSFFFPLDGVAAWNRLCGRRGFVQYQCVLPLAESAVGIAALLERAATAGQGSFLAVLKLFGASGEGLMSFPMEGYTVALDFPMRSGTPALFEALDAITHDHGGRIYLAKDACCTPERVREGYPGHAAFDAVRTATRGDRVRFDSVLSHRLAL